MTWCNILKKRKISENKNSCSFYKNSCYLFFHKKEQKEEIDNLFLFLFFFFICFFFHFCFSKKRKWCRYLLQTADFIVLHFCFLTLDFSFPYQIHQFKTSYRDDIISFYLFLFYLINSLQVKINLA